MTRVAVIGNTIRNIGAACAADFTLAGHEVRYAVFPEEAGQLSALRAGGGFDVQVAADALISGRNGKAVPHAICDGFENALTGAEVVVLDIPAPTLERQFEAILPWLDREVVVHVQSFGYWSAVRLATLARTRGRPDILVCEASIPTHTASLSGNILTEVLRRRGVEIATVPGGRGGEALHRLRTLFPDLIAAPSALQTSLESMNLMVHPAMALLGVGLAEWHGNKGEQIRFYRDCNVPSAGLLSEAMDRERGHVCGAYGVRHRLLPTAIDHYYGTHGAGVHEAVLNCAAYQSFGPIAANTWRDWEAVDVPYGIVPLVLLADQAGVDAPLHRALANILGTVLGIDPWHYGPSLEAMNLVGSPAEVSARYAGG